MRSATQPVMRSSGDAHVCVLRMMMMMVMIIVMGVMMVMVMMFNVMTVMLSLMLMVQMLLMMMIMVMVHLRGGGAGRRRAIRGTCVLQPRRGRESLHVGISLKGVWPGVEVHQEGKI